MKLKSFTIEGKLSGYIFYCPGCKHGHPFHVPQWSFDGNLETPTFSPSLRVFHPEHKDPDTGKKVPEETLCHLFLANGQIRFCSDSKHVLAGKAVPMVDFPDSYGLNSEA